MHRILTPADYRRTAWKNGAGTTSEIAVHPARADFERFVWRASVAEVSRDGAFSTFPGVDRTLVLLRGAGMSLTSAGEPIEVRAPYDPVLFSGDVAMHCALHAGQVRDFNLMIRRAAARGVVTVVREEAASIAPARFRLCFAAAGACECLVAGFAPIRLSEGHSLLVDAEGASPPSLHVNPLSPDAVAIVATIDGGAAS